MSEQTEGHDPVKRPAHYTKHPSGIECIQITEHMGFNLGNVVKYVWRADLKGNSLQDLEKARFYIDRELARRRAAGAGGVKVTMHAPRPKNPEADDLAKALKVAMAENARLREEIKRLDGEPAP